MSASIPAQSTHTWLDDVQALLAGTLFVALGLTMYAHSGLLTGGIAGAAFLARYAVGVDLGLAFFVLNLPFFWLAWKQLGAEFALKSLAAIVLVSVFTTLAPRVVRFEVLNPWLAAVLGGLLIGFGILALLRHRSSVGGVSILAYWLQKTRGISAGKVQLVVDVLIVSMALWVVPLERILPSIIGAACVGAILVLNHRPGRYLGV